MLSLDLTNPANVALAGYAGRIGTLLTEPFVIANTDLAGSLDDFLGAVYALIQAKQHGFTDRTAPINITAVEKRARMIAAGKVRLDGKWIAGGYFNNALFRTAAIYHRVLKIIVGGNGFVPKLLPKAQALYPQWTSRNLDQVHTQVNDLKHTPRGVHDRRTVTFAAAVAAVGELLDLIEAWTAANAPAVPKQQRPTP
jgi:hypothetical protein